MPASLDRARQEWRGNVRLRMGALAIIAFAGIHAVLALSDRQAELAREYARNVDLLARTESAAREQAWIPRSRDAEARVREMTRLMPSARSEGQAQADIQAWLTRIAMEGRLESPRVQVEPALDVPGYPDLWQVMARLDANVPPHHLPPLLRQVTLALPWIRAESLEVTDAQPMRVTLVVRSYVRRVSRDEPIDTKVVGKSVKPILPPPVHPLAGGPALPPAGAEGAVLAAAASALATNGSPGTSALGLAAAGGAPATFGAPAAAPTASAPRRERPKPTYRPPRLVSPERAAQRQARGDSNENEEAERLRRRMERRREAGASALPGSAQPPAGDTR